MAYALCMQGDLPAAIQTLAELPDARTPDIARDREVVRAWLAEQEPDLPLAEQLLRPLDHPLRWGGDELLRAAITAARIRIAVDLTAEHQFYAFLQGRASLRGLLLDLDVVLPHCKEAVGGQTSTSSSMSSCLPWARPTLPARTTAPSTTAFGAGRPSARTCAHRRPPSPSAPRWTAAISPARRLSSSTGSLTSAGTSSTTLPFSPSCTIWRSRARERRRTPLFALSSVSSPPSCASVSPSPGKPVPWTACSTRAPTSSVSRLTTCSGWGPAWALIAKIPALQNESDRLRRMVEERSEALQWRDLMNLLGNTSTFYVPTFLHVLAPPPCTPSVARLLDVEQGGTSALLYSDRASASPPETLDMPALLDTFPYPWHEPEARSCTSPS
ncbi:MAG: hypothetical protein R3B70_22210 [Polyangiaceae bacterium]